MGWRERYSTFAIPVAVRLDTPLVEDASIDERHVDASHRRVRTQGASSSQVRRRLNPTVDRPIRLSTRLSETSTEIEPIGPRRGRSRLSMRRSHLGESRRSSRGDSPAPGPLRTTMPLPARSHPLGNAAVRSAGCRRWIGEPTSIGGRRNRVRHRIMLVASTLLLSACVDSGSNAGPCLHISRDPIITLTSTGVSRLHVRHLRIDGRRVPLNELVAGVADGVGTVADRRGITCQVPCGFGERPGDWKFRVTFPSHRDVQVHKQVAYAKFDGGCPSYSDGGVVIDVARRR
jgi:hypothetical protein